MQGVVEAWVKLHPERSRTREDLEDLEKRNAFVGGGDVKVPEIGGYDHDDGGEDESEYEGSYVEEEVDLGKCKHCPPVTPGAEAADGYECDATNPAHLQCHWCHGYFPNRPDYHNRVLQKCVGCQLVFCDPYWSRTIAGAVRCPVAEAEAAHGGSCGTLQPFQCYDLTAIPPNSLCGNTVEQEFLQLHLSRRPSVGGLAGVRRRAIDAIWECEYTPNAIPPCPPCPGDSPQYQQWQDLYNSATAITDANDAVCADCAAMLHVDVVDWYRGSICDSDLPPEVTARPDCWYGRECTTQFKADKSHARRFNHICENTRPVGGGGDESE
ncbi:hypothetical protein HDU89_008668 [Geranomyces variabilis]|nr:hypothetical protein HDU89_008668 [Geranomyces variabilis]